MACSLVGEWVHLENWDEQKKDEYWEEVVKTLVMDLCQCVVLVGVRWAR